MAEREEFSFEEEESDTSWMEQEPFSESPTASENGLKGSMTRLLLLVLLLVAVGAAGFHFLLGTGGTEPPPPHQVAVKNQPITVPPRPVQETPPPVREAVVPEEAVSQVQTPDTAKPAEEKTVPEKSTEVTLVEPEDPPATAPAGEMSEPPAPSESNYTVEAGAFLLRSNLAGAENKVKESGFDPLVVQKKKLMDMIRLRVGIFTPEEGKKKMEELEKMAPKAFYLPVDGKVAVYAASFQNLDKARSYADRLYKQGLRVEEESAKVEIPLYLLSFGGFADLESAREAAERVRAKGLDAMVVKNL